MKRIQAVVPGTRPELRATEDKVIASRGKITLLYQVLLNSPAICEGWEQLIGRALQNLAVRSPA